MRFDDQVIGLVRPHVTGEAISMIREPKFGAPGFDDRAQANGEINMVAPPRGDELRQETDQHRMDLNRIRNYPDDRDRSFTNRFDRKLGL